MKVGGWLHHIWWLWSDAGWPRWAWRPYCWLRRKHEDDCYGYCVFCASDMEER